MGVVFGVVVVLVVVLVWALYADQPAAEAEPELVPRWDGFPGVEDITRAGFPLAPLGYDRDAVHQHLARVAAAFQAALTARDAVDVLNGREPEDHDVTPAALQLADELAGRAAAEPGSAAGSKDGAQQSSAQGSGPAGPDGPPAV